jgi:hypothetical protein
MDLTFDATGRVFLLAMMGTEIEEMLLLRDINHFLQMFI